MKARDKKQECPDCKRLMKYNGSHIFYCRYCHKKFKFNRIPEYKMLNKKGRKVKKRTGKMKTDVTSWKVKHYG